MTIRAEDIAASEQVTIGEKTYPVVTLQDLMEAAQRLAIVLDLNGGSIAISVSRIPTGLEHESFTTRAVMSWRDYTNARPRPEPDARESEEQAVAEPSGETPRPSDPPPTGPDDDAPAEPDRPQLQDDVGDGLVVDPLAVDESDIPVELRTG